MGLEERRHREKERRRETILKAARRDFMKKGFKAVTVDSIAQRAQLSKGAIYLYFKSKEEIYAQVLIRDIEKFHDRVADIFQGGDSASEVLTRFARIYTDFFLNERELFRILMAFMVQPNPLNISEQINDHIIRSQPSVSDDNGTAHGGMIKSIAVRCLQVINSQGSADPRVIRHGRGVSNKRFAPFFLERIDKCPDNDRP